MNSYKELQVWQKAMDLCELVYDIVKQFPKDELYSLTSQIRRSTVSIPSNIAEGYRRGSTKEYTHFLKIAFGSGAELETQFEISKRVNFITSAQYEKIAHLLDEIMRMLNSMLKKLDNPYTPFSPPSTPCPPPTPYSLPPTSSI